EGHDRRLLPARGLGLGGGAGLPQGSSASGGRHARGPPDLGHVTSRVEPAAPSDVDALVEHLFRHSAGQMVSRLARWLGSARLDLAEEAVQDALVRALQTW